MKIFPAIDLIDGKAVRLKKGDYNEVTVYSDCPPEMAKNSRRQALSGYTSLTLTARVTEAPLTLRQWQK